MSTRIDVIGIGCGSPDHLTLEAVRALQELDVVLLTDKRHGDDPLAHVRARILAAHAPRASVVVVNDPPRQRTPDRVADQESYEQAVQQWHEARAHTWRTVLAQHAGQTVGILVWGDPAFYDSTLRILRRVERADLPLQLRVLPGISAVQLLAARHGLVLNEVGGSVTVTTGRRLVLEAERGSDNLVVMLNRDLEVGELPGSWKVWWGGNLGTEHESLLHGDLSTQLRHIAIERDRLRGAAGWVMDVHLLRRV